MSLALSTQRIKLIVVAFALVLLSFAFAPHSAHAAVVSLSTATTSSNNASTTLAKVGDVISYRIVLTGGVPSATTTPVINILGTGTTSMVSSSGGSWIYSTTTTNTTTWTNGFVPFYIAWGGSLGESTTTIASTSLTSANVRFDKSVPTISSITSDATAAGVLKVGNTIVFTLTPGATEYAATVAGLYNGQSLTWSTANSGATFTATYTVGEGNTDQASALQISGVVITDAAGNASTAGAGSDVLKTIDANSPATPTASLPSGSSISGTEHVVLTSTGSDSIRYTKDGTSPSCSTGFLFSGFAAVGGSETVMAIGCDTAGNSSAVATFSYSRHGGGGGGGSSHRSNVVSSASVTTTSASTPSTTGSASGSFSRDLEVGASGADVMALQVWLNAHGFTVAASGPGSMGQETMTFGSLTKAAVAKFQAAHGISAIGRFGPMTRAALSSM